MTHLGYLLVGWGASLGCGVLYAIRLLLRGRRLSAAVPPGRRRWMTSEPAAVSTTRAEVFRTEAGP